MSKTPIAPNPKAVKWIVLLAVLILAAGGWVWYKKIYLSYSNVYWGMINNNLATKGNTRETKLIADGQTSDQFLRVQVGPDRASQTLEVDKQTDGTEVNRETVGTVDTDYARYSKIKTSNPVNYSSVEGVWGKAEAGGQLQAQNFNQAILTTIPTADFNPQQRQAIIKAMQEKQVFMIDFSKTTKDKQDGKSVFVYDVKINPKPYFEVMKQFIKQMGLNDSIVPDPESYANVAPLELKVSIRPTSRNIAKIQYLSNNQEETYSYYGPNTPIKIPTDTIPITELQQRIQSLQ